MTLFVMNAADAYRVGALLELAAAFPRALTGSTIAARRKIPRAFLARLIRALSESGLVATSRGPSGGVRLLRPPDEITLDVVLPTKPRPLGPRGGLGVTYLAETLAVTRHDVLASISLAALHERERVMAGTDDWQI